MPTMKEADWVPQEYTAKVASTRAVHVAGYDHLMAFSRGALEGMAEQMRTEFVSMSIEHLPFLPPIGRWYDGEVIDAADGEAELIVKGRELRHYVSRSDDPEPLKGVASLPEGRPEEVVSVHLGFERRNFDPDVVDEIAKTCPIPTKEEFRWSGLPPIEWIIAVPVTWGAVKFTGAFFDELGHTAARGLVTWIKRFSAKARAATRDRIVTIAFELDDRRAVHAIVPLSIKESAEDDAKLGKALETVGDIAAFAGAAKEGLVSEVGLVRAVFLYDGDNWKFAWSTDGERIYRTKWFQEHEPDPSLYLGHAMLPDGQSDVEAGGPPQEPS
jgi:hypothetical protein